MTPLEAGTRAWLGKAESDLLCIENNVVAQRVPWDVVVFHAQQAAEKRREMAAAATRLFTTVLALLGD